MPHMTIFFHQNPIPFVLDRERKNTSYSWAVRLDSWVDSTHWTPQMAQRYTYHITFFPCSLYEVERRRPYLHPSQEARLEVLKGVVSPCHPAWTHKRPIGLEVEISKLSQELLKKRVICIRDSGLWYWTGGRDNGKHSARFKARRCASSYAVDCDLTVETGGRPEGGLHRGDKGMSVGCDASGLNVTHSVTT
jgi:hypothetical protein